MTLFPHRPEFLAATAALAAVAMVSTASAQRYTQEEAQACTPDAVKFCSDTIPDVGRTAACIRANFSSLTPACKEAFMAARPPAAAPAPAPEQAPAPAPVTQAAAAPPAPAVPAGPDLLGPDLLGANLFAAPAPAPVAPRVAHRHDRHIVRESRDTRHARHALARACATGYVSADVCQFTARLITLAQ